MKLNWFTRKGIFFFPVSIPGWFIFSATLVYSIYTFIEIDSRQHSVSDTLINFVFRLCIIGVVYSIVGLIAEKRNHTTKN